MVYGILQGFFNICQSILTKFSSVVTEGAKPCFSVLPRQDFQNSGEQCNVFS